MNIAKYLRNTIHEVHQKIILANEEGLALLRNRCTFEKHYGLAY